MSFDVRLPNLFPESRRKQRTPIKAGTKKKILTTPKKCKWCRKSPSQHIHHIDGNPSNNKLSNLINLCATCHVKATDGEISKEQLRRRLGIKPKPRSKRMKKPRRRKQHDILGIDAKIPRLPF